MCASSLKTLLKYKNDYNKSVFRSQNALPCETIQLRLSFKRSLNSEDQEFFLIPKQLLSNFFHSLSLPRAKFTIKKITVSSTNQLTSSIHLYGMQFLGSLTFGKNSCQLPRILGKKYQGNEVTDSVSQKVDILKHILTFQLPRNPSTLLRAQRKETNLTPLFSNYTIKISLVTLELIQLVG